MRIFLCLVYFCVVGGLFVWLYLSYTNEHELSQAVCALRSRTSVLRQEAEQLEVKVENARSEVESLMNEKRKLESESEKLKAKAQELELMWEVAKQCKRDFEEISAEIEALKRGLSHIKPKNR